MQSNELDLIITLSHELAVALEISYDPVDLRMAWTDAVDALKTSKQLMEQKGIVVPDTVNKVIELAQQG